MRTEKWQEQKPCFNIHCHLINDHPKILWLKTILLWLPFKVSSADWLSEAVLPQGLSCGGSREWLWLESSCRLFTHCLEGDFSCQQCPQLDYRMKHLPTKDSLCERSVSLPHRTGFNISREPGGSWIVLYDPP